MPVYGQYCPVTFGSEVLADRWTLMILREMVLGSTRFNDIERGLPGISRTLLVQRLRHLERKGVVLIVPARSGRGNEYELSESGRALEPIIMAIGEWATRWVLEEPRPADVNAVTLTWWLHRRVAPELPERRVVIEFHYTGENRTVIWLVLDRGEPSVCMKHPGFDADIIVTTDPVAFMRVFAGIETLAYARRNGTVVLEGPPALTKAFGNWFLWSPFAPSVRDKLGVR
jgi:DNA-binding HxlR family transcriptional regulator